MILLASASPQRAELLRRHRVTFRVVRSTIDEETVQAPHPQVLALERARAKAHGAEGAAGQVACGADTVVALGREVLGNPKDVTESAAMLSRLSATTHQVFTGHSLVRFAQDGSVAAQAVAVTIARVTMRPLSPAEIQAYAASGEGIGRAGGYAIQERGDRFVVDVQGAWETVVGLHVATIAKLWREVNDSGAGTLPGYEALAEGARP